MTVRNTYTLGLDIGGTNIKIVILENRQRVIFRHQIPSNANAGANAVRRTIAEAINRASSYFLDSIDPSTLPQTETLTGFHTPQMRQEHEFIAKAQNPPTFRKPLTTSHNDSTLKHPEFPTPARKDPPLRTPDPPTTVHNLPNLRQPEFLTTSSNPQTLRQVPSPKPPFFSIGIGCAGTVHPITGVVVNSPNFLDWTNVPLADWVRADTTLPTRVLNDANSATVAEWKLGAARGFHNVILLAFGTGIGGGIIIDGKLFTGSTGTGAELGHITIRYDGIPCNCGNTGCFERYCSASALKRLFPDVSAEEIFTQAPKNPTYREALDDFLNALSIAITGLANAFDPDCILIGGGLSKGISVHLPIIAEYVQKHAFPNAASHVQIRPCELGSWAGAIGAALAAP
ncbi:MAG: ROK family protein [Deltaproteobacteria bacterium]|nr:ROK family protein [Deltaproteobacteria bacterium]